MPLLCILFLDGCTTADKPAIVAVPSPQLTEVPRKTEAAPAKKKKQAVAVKPAVEKPRPRPQTEILLSGEAPAYREIAERLNDSLDDSAIVYTLTGVDARDDPIVDKLRSSPHRRLVAIGLRAAIVAREFNDKQVVFCQVVNFRDHRLISENMKGVGAMPAPDKLFADWKSLAPKLRRVLVVTGDGFDGYIAMARQAASRNGIELIHRVVETDREFLYTVKRDALPTQGHWLLADNRVLSFKTLKDVMAFNAKQAIQTVVFRPELLTFGGLLYVVPSEQEISEKVISRLESFSREASITEEDIVFLDGHEMEINPQVARQLGLTIPDRFEANIHVQ